MTNTIPTIWLPRCRMQRIIVHWTAGGSNPSSNDLSHYHILIDSSGKVFKGTPSIKLNSGSVKKGSGYAAHTLNCNSGSIGVSLCGMLGATENPLYAGKYPITEEQWNDVLPVVLAELCQFYNIPIISKTVLTHAEVQGNLSITQRGKWDIAWLPFIGLRGAATVGDDMRKRAQEALKSL